MSPLDRTRPPVAGPPPPFRSPALWRGQLDGGATVVGTSHGQMPIARLSLALPAGRLAETRATLGLASLTAELLEEGTARRTTVELTDFLDGLGATLHAGATEDELVLSLGMLEEHLPEAVALLGELVLEPGFRDGDFERVKRNRLVAIDTRGDRIRELADDAFAERIHGTGTPKGSSDLGTRGSVESLAADDVRRFWQRGSAAARARITYVGPREELDFLRLFADLDGRWRGNGDGGVLDEDGAARPTRTAPELVLVDVPGARQSELRVGHLGVARSDRDFDPLRALNHVLGGSFSSRINLNLREDKGYTYGAHSAFRGGATPGELRVATAVTTEHTAAALQEILLELRRIRDGVTQDELEFARRSLTRSLLLAFESGSARLSLAQLMGKYDLPADYLERRMAWLEAMRAEDLQGLAQRHVRPDELVLVVAGDGVRLREQLAEARDLPTPIEVTPE